MADGLIRGKERNSLQQPNLILYRRENKVVGQFLWFSTFRRPGGHCPDKIVYRIDFLEILLCISINLNRDIQYTKWALFVHLGYAYGQIIREYYRIYDQGKVVIYKNNQSNLCKSLQLDTLGFDINRSFNN